MDSSVDIAAWLVEKFDRWSDTDGDDVDSTHSKGELLTNIMTYVATRCFNTASCIYYGQLEEGGHALSDDRRRLETPTGWALFPAEIRA